MTSNCTLERTVWPHTAWRAVWVVLLAIDSWLRIRLALPLTRVRDHARPPPNGRNMTTRASAQLGLVDLYPSTTAYCKRSTNMFATLLLANRVVSDYNHTGRACDPVTSRFSRWICCRSFQ